MEWIRRSRALDERRARSPPRCSRSRRARRSSAPTTTSRSPSRSKSASAGEELSLSSDGEAERVRDAAPRTRARSRCRCSRSSRSRQRCDLTSRSRSPSPSRSPSAGRASSPTSRPLNGFARRCARRRPGANALPVFSKKRNVPACSPATRSRVAVGVEVGERGRRRARRCPGRSSGLAAPVSTDRGGYPRTHALEIGERSVILTRDEIESAVAVEIDERGRSDRCQTEPDSRADWQRPYAERTSCAGAPMFSK